MRFFMIFVICFICKFEFLYFLEIEIRILVCVRFEIDKGLFLGSGGGGDF